MQSHLLELAQVVATARTGQGRFNLYAGIHKALRAFMVDTLTAIGRTDPANPAGVAHTAQQTLALLGLFEGHLQHENGFVHPALDARCPGVASRIAGEHVEHEHHIAHLRSVTQALAQGDTREREAALYALYLGMARFVADNLQHMHIEETVHNPALWAAYSDEELIAIHDALVAAVTPEHMALVTRWMLPNLNAPERLEMMQGMRASAPPPAFQGMVDAARGLLPQADWVQLARGLALPIASGLMTA
ncbi:hemerythrin domain-containing protein [Hydrogenophaga sp. BPS33]|uniref:hemerythrin domain-containing protein n=1 Tax=Hydrogenophaga sp. BPS33 TaxID=2651974 RepID=UPI00131F78A6|nr:hemerythrin domain-containing protein [Hydrogenophaga sp. BPS33]QHE88505.1 hypothetical protein F9K07_28305 [Hydrogenophaga sp. BPS33]